MPRLSVGLGCRGDRAGLPGSVGGAQIVARPESKPWNLHEFMARDLDGNLFRVFYDFAWELPDRGGRKDDSAERRDARARL
jgi:hypothetical protein